MVVGKVTDCKSDFQDHSGSLVLVPFNRPHISLVSTLYPFRRIISHFSEFTEIMWPWKHSIRGNLSRVHQYILVGISTQSKFRCV